MLQSTAPISSLYTKFTLDPSDICNYRPLFYLSLLSKLLERAVSQQLTRYLESESLLPQNQFAYRANHSTETAVLRVFSDLVSESDAGNIFLMALLDLSAAFDTVDYEISFRRLEADCGIVGSALS